MEEMSKKRLRREKARQKEMKKLGVLNGPNAGLEAENAQEHAKKPKKRENVWAISSILGSIKNIYETKYKQLLFVTILLLILAIAQISYQVYTTGDFINRGVSLKGGVTITIPNTEYDSVKLETSLKDKTGDSDLIVRKITGTAEGNGLIVDAGLTEKEGIEKLLSSIRDEMGITSDDYSVEMVGSALGQSFFKETFTAMVAAFILMGIVVYIYFRMPVPTAAVMLAAFTDIIETMAFVNIIGLNISTAGIAAFLMLIGYSVDTDILLSTRVLKRREGTILDGVYSAIKTGILMTTTTFVAVTAALLYTNSSVVKEIMIILLVGLAFDTINTWIQNAAILRWYLERWPDKGGMKEDQ